MYEQYDEDSDQGKYIESTGQLLEECGRLAVAAGFAAVAFDRIAVLAIVDEVAAHLFVVRIKVALVLLLEQLICQFGDFNAPVRVGDKTAIRMMTFYFVYTKPLYSRTRCIEMLISKVHSGEV